MDTFAQTLGGSARLRLAPSWVEYQVVAVSGTGEVKIISGSYNVKIVYGTRLDLDTGQEVF
jgi:hypothetical protein